MTHEGLLPVRHPDPLVLVAGLVGHAGVARWGGDEVVILLGDVSEDAVPELARKLGRLIAVPITVGSEEVRVTDAAMYRAKAGPG